MKVIYISGKARAGKDTIGAFLKEKLESEGKRVLIIHYADVLKYLCKEYFNWDGEKDAAGRQLLQTVGTKIRNKANDSFFIDFVRDFVNAMSDDLDYVLIPDCRYPNEIGRWEGVETIHIRVIRPGFESGLTADQKKHESETALDNVIPDCGVMNDDTLAELEKKAGEIAKNI